ncbi:bifunctional adenosylcobinamide kinase/adenosylcobinamide-phosphate guanylyltransferase [Bacillus dakarensis]|uniref:bifunctional adenosylcobinamide kinase/adenosylcobinamide-phosphate guanylyltransferase n=1 Tax=Robertmurraya dakarensis TaxID=1926278 RepID=UPI000980D994|nr:bifunctional adenosylcobinamide kinase/adenosylcobinamide-phosphate guanylyltransferase [Bacillus dakarensis]
MHFVTGGAFNGKRKWVSKTYGETKWISAFQGEVLIEHLSPLNASCVVLEGVEEWLRKLSLEMDINEARNYWKSIVLKWLDWESSAEGRRLVIIGTDLTKGIVPIEKENRNWRDLTGWAYQDLAAHCNKVDIIWYGINQTIKGEKG